MTNGNWELPSTASPFPADLAGPAEPPSPEELDAALTAAIAETGTDELALELATLDQELSADEEIVFSGFQAEIPTLEGLLTMLERYPGLKITLSF